MKKRREEQVKSVEARSLSSYKIKAVVTRCLTSDGSTPTQRPKVEPVVCNSKVKETATKTLSQFEIEEICEAIDSSATQINIG